MILLNNLPNEVSITLDGNDFLIPAGEVIELEDSLAKRWLLVHPFLEVVEMVELKKEEVKEEIKEEVKVEVVEAAPVIEEVVKPKKGRKIKSK